MNAVKIKTYQGMTLLELMIVLAIASILITSAVPSFSQMLSRNQQLTQLHILFKHLHLARSEAIKTNSRILLCKSSNGIQCTKNAQWSDGWIVFSDKDKNNKLSSNEQITYSYQALPNNLSLQYRGRNSANYITYYADGRSSTNGTFTLCNHATDNQPKGLVISRTGRIRLASENSAWRPHSCS